AFDGEDPCLDVAGTTLSDADTVVVNGRTYRAGGWTSNGFEASVAAGPLVLDFASGDANGRIAGITAVRLLTSGAHGANNPANYTVTFDYESATDVVVNANIKHDTATNRGTVTAEYSVAASGLADAGSSCGEGTIDEVRVTNPAPGTPARVTIAWQHDDGVTA